MKDESIKRKVQETLESVEQIRRVEPDPYLATRVLARWSREQESGLVSNGAWKWQLALVAVLLIVNAWTLLPKWVNTDARADYLNSVAADYGIDGKSNTVYDYSQLN